MPSAEEAAAFSIWLLAFCVPGSGKGAWWTDAPWLVRLGAWREEAARPRLEPRPLPRPRPRLWPGPLPGPGGEQLPASDAEVVSMMTSAAGESAWEDEVCSMAGWGLGWVGVH